MRVNAISSGSGLTIARGVGINVAVGTGAMTCVGTGIRETAGVGLRVTVAAGVFVAGGSGLGVRLGSVVGDGKGVGCLIAVTVTLPDGDTGTSGIPTQAVWKRHAMIASDSTWGVNRIPSL